MAAPVASVLFVCVKNGGKSQMAAGLMKKVGGDAVHVDSAGANPGFAVNDLSAACLQEVGVDITGEIPKAITAETVRGADLVVVLGHDARVDQSDGTALRAGTPTSPPSAVSKASNACASSVMTSRPGSRIWLNVYSAPEPRHLSFMASKTS